MTAASIIYASNDNQACCLVADSSQEKIVVRYSALMTFTPYTERGPYENLDQYQTISFLSEYAHLSLEELRLEDYKHGRTQSPRPINGKIATLSLEMPLI